VGRRAPVADVFRVLLDEVLAAIESDFEAPVRPLAGPRAARFHEPKKKSRYSRGGESSRIPIPGFTTESSLCGMRRPQATRPHTSIAARADRLQPDLEPGRRREQPDCRHEESVCRQVERKPERLGSLWPEDHLHPARHPLRDPLLHPLDLARPIVRHRAPHCHIRRRSAAALPPLAAHPGAPASASVR